MTSTKNNQTQLSNVTVTKQDVGIEVGVFDGKWLGLLLEAAPVAIVTTNQAGQILFGNAKLAELFGYNRQELIGCSIEVLLPERLHAIHVEHRRNYTAAPRVRAMGSGLNLVARHKNGTEFPIEVGLGYVQTEQEMIVIASIIDITIRKDLAEILEQRVVQRTHEIEQRRRVSDGLRDILTILNSNKSLEEILDYTVAQAVDLFDQAEACAIYHFHETSKQFVIQASHGLSEEYIQRANVPIGKHTIGQMILTRQPVAISDVNQAVQQAATSRQKRDPLLESGHQAYLAAPLLVKDEIYGALVLYYPQTTKFSNDEFNLAVTFSGQAVLAIENARLRTQAEQAAVTAERNRLARDLHDSVTQTLFSASVIADVLPRLWEVNRDEGRRRSQELQELTRGALAEMRTLLLELRPAKLVEIPLSDLLQQLTEAVIGRARVPIILNIEGQCKLPPDIQIAFYRTAQEALNNVAKHARAKQAIVTLRCQPNRVELSIRDDGCGFTMTGIKPENLGLSIIKERAEAIQATLEIKSKLGQGTEVIVIREQ